MSCPKLFSKQKLYFLFLSAITFLTMIEAGQKPTGLAASRQQAQKTAMQQPKKGLSAKAPVKKQLSPAIMAKLEEEQQKIQAKSKPEVVTPKQTVETKPLGEIKPAVVEKTAEPKLIKAEEVSAPIAVEKEKPTISKEKEEGDRYVQTVAHLQLDDVQHRMADFLQQPIGFEPKPGEILPAPKKPNEMVTPYLNLVAEMINKEVELKDTHYVFYHGLSNPWRVVQDFYKQVYAYYNPLKPVKDFTFVRFTDMPSIKAQDYLSEAITTYAGVNDNKLEVRTLLLPVNLALFGNVGFPGECSWNYFLSPKSHLFPKPEETLQPLLDAFNLKYDLDTFAKEIEDLAGMLVKASPEQTLLQIFIPQEKVDDVAYLAWIIGFPAHAKSMALAESIFEGKPKVGHFTGPAVKKVMKMYKAEGEDNPLYKELLEAVENGDFGVDAFLKVYRNNPSELQNVNDTQARLVITNDVLLNPESGVKFFSYFTTPRDVQDTYIKKLNELVKKVINANKSKKK